MVMMFLIFQGSLSVGHYMALLFYSFFIFGPLQELGTVIQIYREAQISLGNFADIMNTAPEAKPQNPVPVPQIETLEFQNVINELFADQRWICKQPIQEGLELFAPRG